MKKRRGTWSGPDRRQPPLVLVACDDVDAAELLSRVLETRGFRATTASTVEDAMSRSIEQLPRGVIIDLSSRGVGSSLQLLELLRHHDDRRVRAVRAVVVARSAANRNFSFQSGADGFLERPFHVDDLVAAITEALSVPPEERAVHRRDQLR